jgi:hypothetical protein
MSRDFWKDLLPAMLGSRSDGREVSSNLVIDQGSH